MVGFIYKGCEVEGIGIAFGLLNFNFQLFWPFACSFFNSILTSPTCSLVGGEGRTRRLSSSSWWFLREELKSKFESLVYLKFVHGYYW